MNLRCAHMCSAVEAQEYLRHRNTLVIIKRPMRFPDDTIGPSPLLQLMPMKVTVTLLLWCLVLVAHTHAMLQVHSGFREHGDKSPRWPRQEAALGGECMPMIPFIYWRFCVRRLEFIIVGLAYIARLVSQEGPERLPKVTHEPNRCCCCFLSPPCSDLNTPPKVYYTIVTTYPSLF